MLAIRSVFFVSLFCLSADATGLGSQSSIVIQASLGGSFVPGVYVFSVGGARATLWFGERCHWRRSGLRDDSARERWYYILVLLPEKRKAPRITLDDTPKPEQRRYSPYLVFC